MKEITAGQLFMILRSCGTSGFGIAPFMEDGEKFKGAPLFSDCTIDARFDLAKAAQIINDIIQGKRVDEKTTTTP